MFISNKRMNDYKAVIFDFDYTLADSSKGVYECISYALKEMRYDCPGYEEICRTIGKHLKEVFVLFTGNNNPEQADLFLKLFKDKADEIMAGNTIIFNEVRPVFKYLQCKNIKCGIVSTKYRYRIENILDRDGLGGFVDIIIGGEDVAKCKPDPEGLLKAIEYLNLRNEDCLYAGDSLVDAETAKKAEVDFAAVLTGTTKREEFDEYKPLFILNKLDELIKMYEDILIREISDNEIDSSARVIRDSFSTVAREFNLTPQSCPTNPAFITSDVLCNLKEKGICILGLFKSGIQIGFVAVEKADEKKYYMEKLAIDPQYRHCGYGSMLMDYVVNFVRSKNGSILSIGIINANHILKKWYNDYGFKETGCKKFAHLPFTVCFMEKEIIYVQSDI